MNDYAGPEKARFLARPRDPRTILMLIAPLLALDIAFWIAIGIFIGWAIWAQ